MPVLLVIPKSLLCFIALGVNGLVWAIFVEEVGLSVFCNATLLNNTSSPQSAD